MKKVVAQKKSQGARLKNGKAVLGKGNTFGEGKMSEVLECTVTKCDRCDAEVSKLVITVTVKGSEEFELEQNKDLILESLDEKYSKQKKTTVKYFWKKSENNLRQFAL